MLYLNVNLYFGSLRIGNKLIEFILFLSYARCKQKQKTILVGFNDIDESFTKKERIYNYGISQARHPEAYEITRIHIVNTSVVIGQWRLKYAAYFSYP